MKRIIYEYRGLKAIPTKWCNGIPIKYRYEEIWYKGSETIEESKVKERVKDLGEIVNDYGKKKYRNIVVLN